MRKPEVDYRQFRLSKIHEPEFCHLKLLFGWVVYFVLYFLTESLIPPENCTPVHIPLDDWIPFNEWFVIPYVFWYGLIVYSLGYFLMYHVDSFRRLQTYIIITQLIAMGIYILFPSRQDLRPEVFPRDNLLTDLIKLLYTVDTNTGVCPSLHVAYSLGIASVWLRQKDVGTVRKGFIVLCVILICLSTMFIKQHSAADFFAALPVCMVAEGVVYGKDDWFAKLRRKTE